jgi:hypothetical protein
LLQLAALCGGFTGQDSGTTRPEDRTVTVGFPARNVLFQDLQAEEGGAIDTRTQKAVNISDVTCTNCSAWVNNSQECFGCSIDISGKVVQVMRCCGNSC